jgi:hypothetical protein
VNRWGIPEWLEIEVLLRDTKCIYCNIEMLEAAPASGSRKYVATWEHIINDASIVTLENIARCCTACNASKGAKSLADWLSSPYCEKRGITKESIAEVAQRALLADA